ncbi:MAG: aspartate-semialdehyde dehydrogenase [Candidatus Acidiferrum sp.]
MASTRIVIAGASSLLGAELKSLLEESRFAAADFRLVDEEIAAGILTEAAGEAAIIQPVEADSFNRANIIFFTGSAGFASANLSLARSSGATIIDMSGAFTSDFSSRYWFSNLDALRPQPFPDNQKFLAIPSAAAIAGASLTLALENFRPEHLTLVALQPVSESGKKGIEELEQQTTQLLSFKTVGSPIFDTQVGFNILDRFGPASAEKLSVFRDRLRRELAAILGPAVKPPAAQLIHAPVFYGTAFTLSAKLTIGTDASQLVAALRAASCFIATDSAPGNLSAAGESLIQVAPPERDPSSPNLWWFFGAADNIRLPAYNAVKLAEKLFS